LQVFQALVVGLVTRTGDRTVCGMLTGAGLATSGPHHRTYRFFSTARWQVDQIGLTVFDRGPDPPGRRRRRTAAGGR
jgi:hypothetical protein